ncbi:MAG: HipA domain-containing protein, partial [Devosia sp.]
ASVLRGPDGTSAELAKFFRSFVLSIAVRNGDAHRKNFGVIYGDATGHVTLAPTFDVITTTLYLPNDSLALTLDGTKRWPDAKRLVKFGIRHCGLTSPAAKSILSEVAEAVVAVSKDLTPFSDLDQDAHETRSRMKFAWEQGVAALSLSA